jgi:hypothetical protein
MVSLFFMRTEIQNHKYSTHDGLTGRFGNSIETIGECVDEMNDLLTELVETRRRYAEACAVADGLVARVEQLTWENGKGGNFTG